MNVTLEPMVNLKSEESVSPPARRAFRGGMIGLFALIMIVGAAVRIYPSIGFKGPGADEHFYRLYVRTLEKAGLSRYPELFEHYIVNQLNPKSQLMLPPGRVLFLVSALEWRSATGVEPLEAVRAVSCVAGILLLLVSGMFAWRAGGAVMGVCVAALMAVSPLELMLSQRALIDGFFALWATIALWALWELFQTPRSKGWLALYGFSLLAMVLTKENAAFVTAGLFALLAANRWAKFGETSREVWVVTFAAPLVACSILIFCAGGWDMLLASYRVYVAKSYGSPYAIETGDGPWYRYLIELVMMNPVVFVLAVAGLGHLAWRQKASLFLALFVGITFLLMCRLQYGLNLRYTNIWDLPIRWFAVSMLLIIAGKLPPRVRGISLAGAVAIIAAAELAQYYNLFVIQAIYDPIPLNVEKALFILKNVSVGG